MTAENTLQWMMDFYSDLFPTRQRCLDHLFCTIGNGYEWVNGELVCEDFLSKRYVMVEQIERAKAWHEDLYEQHRKIELELAKKHPDHKPNPKYFIIGIHCARNIHFYIITQATLNQIGLNF